MLELPPGEHWWCEACSNAAAEAAALPLRVGSGLRARDAPSGASLPTWRDGVADSMGRPEGEEWRGELAVLVRG